MYHLRLGHVALAVWFVEIKAEVVHFNFVFRPDIENLAKG